MCETFYHQYAIPDSSVQGRGGLNTPAAADFHSIFGVESIPVSRLAAFETCSETVEMFSEFIIISHLRPKQCLFQKSIIGSQSVTQRRGGGQQPFNLTMPSLLSHKWKLNLTHTTLCPYKFLNCLQLHGKQEAPDLQITSYFIEL